MKDNDKKKHLVFVVCGYYPYYAAVGRCMGNIIEELQDDYKITVIAFADPASLPQFEKYQNTEIIRIKTKEQAIRDSLLIQKNDSKLKIIYKKIALLSYRIYKCLEIILSPTSIDKECPALYLEELKKCQNVDAVIGSLSPIAGLYAISEYLQDVDSSIPFIPVLFDAFSQSQTLHRLKICKKLKFNRHLQIERKIFEHSKRIMYVPSWQKHLDKYFFDLSDKFLPTEHPLLSNMVCLDNPFKAQFKDKINIVYTGSLTTKLRPPQYTLKLFAEVIKRNSDVCLHFWGAGAAMKYVEQYHEKFPHNIFYHGYANKETLSNALMSADFQLSIGATNIPQLSSKIFEYIATGKPIIHLSINEEEPIIEILKNYPFACCMFQYERDFQDNIDLTDAFILNNLHKKLDFRAVSQSYQTALPSYSANLIKKVIEGKFKSR